MALNADGPSSPGSQPGPSPQAGHWMIFCCLNRDHFPGATQNAGNVYIWPPDFRPLQTMRVFYRLALLAVFLVAPVIGALMAQPGPGGPPPCWPPPCIPIDGGLSLLIGAGALLGGKKALDARKARKAAL